MERDFTEISNIPILQVLPVKEMLSGLNFHTHRITSHLSYHFKQEKKEHFLRLNLQWSHLVNNENVITKETVNGITITHVHGSNRIFEQDVFSVHPEYEWISPRTELRLGTNISTFRRLTTQMYPYVVSEKMLCTQTYVSSVFHMGKLDLKAAASFAIGNFTEKNRTTATDTEPGDPPYRLTDYYNLKNEYATAPQATFVSVCAIISTMGSMLKYREVIHAVSTCNI